MSLPSPAAMPHAVRADTAHILESLASMGTFGPAWSGGPPLWTAQDDRCVASTLHSLRMQVETNEYTVVNTSTGAGACFLKRAI